MERISGVDIPNEKRVVVSLTYIYGIGDSTAKQILKDAKVSEDTRVKNLTEDELGRIRAEIAKNLGAEVADGMRILYGGSVKPENAKELLGVDNVDGA